MYEYSRTATKVTRQKGTCGYCGHMHKTPNGLLANHGYVRPGYGKIEQECPGSRMPPLEVSKATAELGLSDAQTALSRRVEDLRDLDTADELTYSLGSFGRSKTYQRSEMTEAKWQSLVDNKKATLKSQVMRLKEAVSEYEKVLSSWKVQPLVEVDEELAQRQRQEKKQDVFNKRLVRYQGLLDKVQARLKIAWKNLQQRESKAKKKPSPKAFIELAKSANILYNIYTGSSYKLAEAHPDPDYHPLDVIEDLKAETVWRHLGAMRGSQYVDRREIEKGLGRHAQSGVYGFDSDTWQPNWPGWTKSARTKEAAFFEVGDIVLYGKYKNKLGRIVRFGDDGKGNPTVEIEPIPKGRKQNKTFGLFKIWKQRDVQKAAALVTQRYLGGP